MIYGSAFGWASEVQKPQRFFGFRVDFRSTETPKIRSAIRVGFRSMEKPSFIRPFGWASEVWKNQVSFGRSGGLLKYRNPKDSFGRSGGLPKYGKTKFRSDIPKNGKIPRFFGCASVFRRTGKFQDSFRWASVFRRTGKFQRFDSEERKTKKPRFVRSGGLSKNENPKIRSDGLPKNENPKIKIRRCLPKNGKNQDSFSGLPKNNGKPRFVWCLGWVLINRKKPKILLVGFQKIKILVIYCEY
ncbi:unnamed protein product [Rhizophagus irregularis]|nr:unnamed protein product [Rhizophagus irregularis]